MAFNTNVVLENSADGYLAEGKSIKGGYFVIDALANIPAALNVKGAKCYNQADDKVYVYNGSSWAEDTGSGGTHLYKHTVLLRLTKTGSQSFTYPTATGTDTATSIEFYATVINNKAERYVPGDSLTWFYNEVVPICQKTVLGLGNAFMILPCSSANWTYAKILFIFNDDTSKMTCNGTSNTTLEIAGQNADTVIQLI